MKPSPIGRGTFAILSVLAIVIALPLLPLCGFLLQGSPEAVFFLGAAAFIVNMVLLLLLFAAGYKPTAGSPPAIKAFHFSIRDLLCLTTCLFGITVFIVSGFRCEATERAAQPAPLPPAAFRHFVWELECGLACLTLGGLIWLRPTLAAENGHRIIP